MTDVSDATLARARVESSVGELVGRRVLGVKYWDVYHFGTEPRAWDNGDWHRAVMGVEFSTDAGPASVIWTATFFPYGVEVLHEPMARHLVLGPEGPEGWDVGSHPLWRERMESPVRGTATFWDPIELGPATVDGVRAGEPKAIDLPVALRLDFDAGPVWFVAALPPGPGTDAIGLGDEVLVVFTPERMREFGFPKTEFLDARSAR